jgi:hypothetical protein
MTWHTAAHGETNFSGAAITVALPPSTRSSGLRIVFTQTPENTPATLAEVQVRGSRAP